LNKIIITTRWGVPPPTPAKLEKPAIKIVKIEPIIV
jgi:hypothetical protein